ncbi:MAG: DUF2796 domain-containing protein [Sulfitobacter sp.]
MKFTPILAACAVVATPLAAQETRHLGAHEHGVGQLDIAIDAGQIAMALHAPGADIVGFEYAAQSAEDTAKVEDAIALLTQPLQLFVIPQAAGCEVTQASAALESEGGHDDHDHDAHEEEHGHDDHDHDAREDEHGHDDHDHDAHKDEHGHDDHDHDAHKDEHGHDDHDHDAHEDERGHDDHDHDAHEDEHGHDEHATETSHTEFAAEYLLTCAAPQAATHITFAYFDAFPNSLKVNVQVASASGAHAYEVTRDAPFLDLSDDL